jgi:hypothetical protein
MRARGFFSLVQCGRLDKTDAMAQSTSARKTIEWIWKGKS